MEIYELNINIYAFCILFSDEEKVSEDDQSGEEEDFVPDATADEPGKHGKGKRKRNKKKDASRY